MSSRVTRELRVVHISDLHFGSEHRFEPPRTPAGDRPTKVGWPTLADKLAQDLDLPDPGCPVLVCVTGDFTTTADFAEYEAAWAFLKGLTTTKIYGRHLGLDSFFVVAGNHDVKFAASSVHERISEWTSFANRVCGTAADRLNPLALPYVFDRIDESGVIVLGINSSLHVEKGKPDEIRGHVDMAQLDLIEQALEGLPKDRLHSAIRIALIHHHPVLMPLLAEPGRGYDAAHNAGRLLDVLRRFEFHLLLHGHKHHPFTFTEDSRSAFRDSALRSLLVVGGGSIGSNELPDYPKRCNCYNRISVKWNPSAAQSRMKIETRGLQMFLSDGSVASPLRWWWKTIADDDRSSYGLSPEPKEHVDVPLETGRIEQLERERQSEYLRTRGNMPAIKVLPSLDPNSAYEAWVWIVGHGSSREEPTSVVWYAEVAKGGKAVSRDRDPNFCGLVHYSEPMLVIGELTFSDGTMVPVTIYASIPGSTSPEPGSIGTAGSS